MKNVDCKKDPGRVSCSKGSAILLFLIALAAIILTAFVTYWITKGIYDHSADVRPYFADELFETLVGSF